jgi:hypothetical protein
MSERSPYTLDADQLQKAVRALEKAAQTLRPKPSEERLYRFLGICVRVAAGALAGMVLSGVMLGVVLPREGEADTAMEVVFGILTGVFILLFLLAAIGALIFLLLNQSVIRQAFRQRRLLTKLGIREVSLSAWRLQRRRHRWSKLAGAVLTAGGIFALALGSFGMISMVVMSIYTKMEHIKNVAITGVSLYGLFFAFGVTILLWRFVQRSREQWAIVADANQLRSALESVKSTAAAGEAVTIPAAVLEDAARIERVQIAREQRDAVVASAGTTDHGYGVLVARDVSSQKALLDPQQRVAAEDLIENLSANPRPAGVESTAKGLLSVRTPERDVELQYSVDEGARRVHVVALTALDHC